MTGRPHLDTRGAWDEAAEFPEQLARGLEAGRDGVSVLVPALARVGAVVAVGVGPAGTACETAAALTAGSLAVPFVVRRNDELPAFVDASTLVFVVSAAADTYETRRAGQDALDRGATVVALGPPANRELAALASGVDGGALWYPASEATGADRASLPALLVPLLLVLGQSGLGPDWVPSIERAVPFLTRRRDAYLAPDGAAEELARRIGRTFPLVYGSSGIGAIAARWWKERVNLHAKCPAFFAEVPSLTYDELAGWGQSGDVTRQILSLVLLRQAGESQRTADLFAAIAAATDEVMADLLDVEAEGDDDLCRFLDLALLGEIVSLHLAAKEGVDPGPAPAIDDAQTNSAQP